MTILLLTRENSSYNSTTKEFTFNLDKQLEEKVKHIRFQTFSFRPSTAGSYPHGILACSKALSNLSLREHVSVLKDTNHRDDTDVLCCLHKHNHNSEHLVYTLRHPVMMTLDRRSFIKTIDMYFTDMSGTRLDGDYVIEAPASPNAADIEALYVAGSVKIYYDAQKSGVFERGDGQNTALGEEVAGWSSRFADVEFEGDVGSSEVILNTFTTKPLIRCVEENTVGTHNDTMKTLDVGFTIPNNGSLFALFETPSSLPATERMHSCKRQFIMFCNGSALGVKMSHSPGTVTDMITGIETSTAYVVELRWDVIAGSPHNTANYSMYLTKLKTTGHSDTVATTTGVGVSATTGNNTTLEIGTTSVDMKFKYSSFIILDAPAGVHSTANRTACKNYLIKKWEGVETESLAVDGAVSSSWLTEIRY